MRYRSMKSATRINTHHFRCNDDKGKRHISNNIFQPVQLICICIFITMVGLCYFMFINQKDPIPNTGKNTKGIPVQSTGPDLNTQTNSKYFDPKEVSNRMITNIILDKPIYRPSETLYLTAFLFNGVSMLPEPKTSKHEFFQLQIIDSKDTPIVDEHQSVEIKNSILGLQYKLPSYLKGGEYQIKIKYNNDRYKATAVRKFQILNSNSRMNPKIRKQIEFLKKSYSAGENCELKILCIDCSNNILVTSIIAKIDNNIIYKLESSPLTLSYDVDKNDDNIQSTLIQFKMPDNIDVGNGNIAVTYQQDSVIETLTKTIPITLNYLEINVYPESNKYLIPGLNNQRVYFEGFNPKTKEPADYEGQIISLPGENIVAQVSSTHEGRAVSDYFNVETDKKYELRLTSPGSCKGQIVPVNTTSDEDMKLIKQRAVLTSTKYAYGFDEQIEFKMQPNVKDKYTVKLFKREELIASIDMNIEKIHEVYDTDFDVENFKANHIGILRMAIFTSDNIPIAERLIFRHPNTFVQFEMDFKVVADIEEQNDKLNAPNITNKNDIIATPSDGIEVSIYSYLTNLNDFSKQPISVVGNVFVSDDSLSSIIDNRLLPPRLSSLVLFESEVDHLEDANIYLPYSSQTSSLSSNNDIMNNKIKEANIYIDLLLGTQGWRRFVYKNVDQVFKEHSGQELEKYERLLSIKQYRPPVQLKMGRMRGARVGMVKKMFQFAAAPMNDHMMDIMAEEMHVNVDGLERGIQEEMDDEQDEFSNESEEENENEDDIIVANMAQHAILPLNPKNVNGVMYERIYAKNQRKFSRKEFEDGIIRRDFESTVYVSRDINTVCYNDDYCGQSFRFGLSDVIGIYKVFIDGYSLNKQDDSISFGSNIFNIKTELPLEIDAILPSILIAGDEPLVPVMIQTSSKQKQIEINIDFDDNNIISLKNNDKKQAIINNVNYTRIYMPLKSLHVNNKTNILLSVINDNKYKDSIKKEIEVVIGGFEQTISSGGLIGINEKSKKLEFGLPFDYIENTLNVEIKAYASPIGQLNEAIKQLIREPCGCFEQTSSTIYPLIMALKYMNTDPNTNVDISFINKAKNMLKKGYKKLISFESKGGGFEWFGGHPGHEALTAYGILEFVAMNSNDINIPNLVDENMLKRTINWLLQRKDNNGGYKRNEKSLDSFGRAPIDTTNAYITWSLIKSGLFKKGDNKLEKEINSLLQLAKQTSDAYIIALGALTAFQINNNNNNNEGIEFLDRLVSMQDKNTGLVKQVEATITNSGGKARDIEATALTAMAFMASNNDSYASNIRLAIEFLSNNCKNGAFLSTQATALSLEAIIEYDKLFSQKIGNGQFQLYINQNLIQNISLPNQQILTFNSDKINEILLNNNSKHIIELKLIQENESEMKMPYSIYISYNVQNPTSNNNNNKVSVELNTNLLIEESVELDSGVKEGDIITLDIELKNLKQNDSLSMVVAIIGIPGGFELRIDQLRELKQGNIISYYETKQNELILYFRAIEKGKILNIPVQLLAVIPGKYTSPASRAYLFYTSEYKSWSNAINVNIKPNKEFGSFHKNNDINYIFQ